MYDEPSCRLELQDRTPNMVGARRGSPIAFPVRRDSGMIRGAAAVVRGGFALRRHGSGAVA